MEFLLGSKKEFFEFINSITKKDKIGILTHTDLDGIASGIFLEKILKAKKLNLEKIYFIDLKPNMIKNLIPKLKEKKLTKIFISDLAVDSADLEGFYEAKKEFDIFMIDHHQINKNFKSENVIKTNSGICVASTIYDLGKGLIMEENWKWLACAAIVSDYTFYQKDQFDFVKKDYPDFNLEKPFATSIGKIAEKISYALVYFNAEKVKVYEAILNKNLEFLEEPYKKVKEEIDYWVDNFESGAEYFPNEKIYFYGISPKFGKALITNIISSEKIKGETLISYVKKRGGLIGMSARNQLDKVDMNLLMKKGIKGLKNAIGGGHKKASGATIMEKDFGKFKENVLKELRQGN